MTLDLPRLIAIYETRSEGYKRLASSERDKRHRREYELSSFIWKAAADIARKEMQNEVHA